MITKAVIPCGGLGTRLLPATKSLPKELLPIIDTPALLYIMQEAAWSGITDVLIILSPDKQAVKHFFTFDKKLDETLLKAGKAELAESLKNLNQGINITFTVQNHPRGSADAVFLAQKFTGSDPFCLALGDDVMLSDTPVMSQLIKAYQKSISTVVGVQRIDTDDITKYGVAILDDNQNQAASNSRLIKVKGFAEKPDLAALPSRYAAMGRYVLTPQIYEEIKRLKPIKGEYRLTDAIANHAIKTDVFALDFEAKRFDMGDRLGIAKAAVEFTLNGKNSREFKEYLKALTAQF